MDKKVPVKTLYLLLVITIGLIVLGIGSTYALFTASAEISDPISLSSNLSYNGDLIETVSVNVPAGGTVSNVLNITNSTGATLNYTTWYIDNGLDIELGTSGGSPTGSLAGNSNTSVSVDIRNNEDSNITIVFGISSNSSSVVLGKGMTIIPNEKLTLKGAALYITNLYLGANPTQITQSGSGSTYYYAESVGLMNDGLDSVGNATDNGNIRYYGSDPDNYIYFNCDDYTNQTAATCEKWRIIGVVDGKIKIIKMESLGTLSWDNSSESEYSNNWNDSSVKDLLNYNYYNNIDKTDYYIRASSGAATVTSINFATDGIGVKNDETRNFISESIWHLGGYSTDGIYVDDIYKYERGNDVYSGRPLIWTGNVGLIYPSDYAYASDLSVCDKTLVKYSEDSNCTGTNWLYNGRHIWTITPKSNSATEVTRVYQTGHVSWNYSYLNRRIYPTVYLNSDVNIAEGDGTSDSPYKIYVEVPATKYITNLYLNNKDKVVKNGPEGEEIEYQYAESVNLMNDRLGGTTEDYDAGNIRYYGKNPNNYVDIGDRTSDGKVIPYRIIGVFKDIETSDGSLKQLIKVIRADSIGEYSWDNKINGIGSAIYDGSNDWTDSRLMMLLNPGYDKYSATNPFKDVSGDTIYGYEGSLWWNSKSGTCYAGESNATKSCDFTSTGLSSDVHNKIETVMWNLGGHASSDVYSNVMYTAERGTTVYGERATEWTGKVALMHASDYGYATDLSECNETLSYYDSSDNSYACRSNDWLYNGVYQWQLTPRSSDAYSACLVYSAGYAYSGDDVRDTNVVRPVFYLNSELVIESGEGTDKDPYVIG